MTTFTKSIYTVLLLTALLLTGCANAGKDQKVDATQTVTLDGSKSKADLFGNVTGFKWKQVKLRGKSELKVTLTAKNTATPSFTAPSVEKKSILYFRLEAIETGGIISPFTTKDTVQVEVSPVTSTNKAPKAKASASPKKVLEGEEVHFDGSASTDSDGQIVSYVWSDDEGRVLSTQQSFTHVFSTKGKHTLTLKVTDDEDASDSTTVRVKVKEAPTPKVSILVDQVHTSEKTVVQGTTLAFEAVLLEEDEHTDKKHHKNKKKHHKKHHDDTPVYTWKDAQGNILSQEMGFSHTFTTVGTHIITLEVTEGDQGHGSKDMHTASVTIIVIDVTPPVLTLNGQANITLQQNAVYTEEGATAVDAVDGNLTVNISGTVDTAVVGTHTLTYTAQDGAGNEANITRSITVIDVTPPVLKLNGDATITLKQNAVYTELGATAVDAVDGNVTVTIIGNVDTSTVGSYTVTYSAQDGAGNEANITRTITIIDVTPPVITLNGEATITLEQNAVYTELGATAVDAVDGNLTVNISGAVDTAVVGTHTLTYTAQDNSGNEANITRSITVIDVTPPVITLNGQSNITLEQNAVYTELGATAVDAVDGNVSVTISGNVDTATVGSYTVTYTAQDSAGNEANATRTITIVDVTPPVITLNGDATITLEQNAVYTELGATAVDAVDGNVSVTISGNVDTSMVGSYTVTYTAQDSAGNEANATRTITIVDVTPPVITLNGDATITLEQNAVYTELGATAVDAVDGNVSVTISGNVDTSMVGSYTVTYSAQDGAGNEANITRSIRVIDVTPPVLKLNGDATITLKQNAVYTELGATAVDAVDGNLTVNISGAVDTAVVGTHTLTYTAQDNSGNEANITRSITVIDVTPPVITLNGQSNITLEQNAVYTELGATAVDAVDGNVTVTSTGNVDTATVGSYTVTYSAQDSAGNEANATRTIMIVDVTPPVITLNGEANITLEQNENYTELGATAVDAVDGNLTVSISGAVDTAVVGTHTLTYTAQDNSGNEANITRTITIIDVTPPVITLNGQSNITLEQNENYTEEGATAVDAVDGNLTVSISGTVDTSTVGNYTLTYTATDSAGNEANVTRSVEVVNTTPTLTSITLESNATTVNVGDTVQLTVTSTYSDGSSSAVDENITYTINPTENVEVNGSVLRAKKDGNVTVQTTIDGVNSNTIALNITWVVDGHVLPPEPDKALNDSTLLGIDSNNNGVRDDVERWIYEEYKDKHPIHIDIGMQAARGYKLVLETPEKAKEIHNNVGKAADCEAYYKYDAEFLNEPLLITKNIDSRDFRHKIYFNTQERMDAYRQYDTLLSGDSYTLPSFEEEKEACDFNTTKYEE